MIVRRRSGGVLPPLPQGDGPQEGAAASPARTMPLSRVVEALYAALVARPPTPREIEEGEALIARDGGSATGLANALVDRVAFRGRVEDVRRRYGLSEERLVNDVSQNGEVELLIKLIVAKGCPTRTVVDVGANGRDGSNSYDLLRYFGWKGLLVEANPRLADTIAADFHGLDCRIASCAVSDYEGEAAFTVAISDEVSSLDAAHAAMWGPPSAQVTVPVRRLGPLMEEHDIPRRFDLLSLDIEGHDVRALNDLVGTSDYRPQWIILEGPSGGFEADLEAIGCSPAVVGAYHVVATTLANLILERHEEA